jgi:predicted enzyme related to lactoylglutathione lyase
MQSSVVHFEVHADDPERCAKFYSEVFGWEVTKWDNPHMEYWMVMTCPKGTAGAINGGIVRRQGPRPAVGAPVSGYVCTLAVTNLDAKMEEVVSRGGLVALPKFAIPGMAWQGYCIDTEGNIFGLHQPDESAK